MVMSSECVIDDVSSKGRSSQFAHDMQYPFGMKMVALYSSWEYLTNDSFDSFCLIYEYEFVKMKYAKE